MYRFWNTVIEPALRAVDARHIIEIGSDQGLNTRNLMAWCASLDGHLDVIDPLPKYDPEVFFKGLESHVSLHRALSLNALPRIAAADAVLIDGDHNWYSVFHELKLIEQAALADARPFPLVLLHDVGWPYGRRDLYYDPDTIPPAYRKPWRRLGMRPDRLELVEEGGLNPHLCNSIYEHPYQNGVLTAVEDFLAQSSVALRLDTLPGMHGLGLLYRAELAAASPLADWLDALRPSPAQRAYLDAVEQDRLAALLRLSEQDAALERQHDAGANLARRLAEHETQLAELEAQLARSRQEHETQVAELEAQLARSRQECEAQARSQQALAERIEDSEALRVDLADRLAHSEQIRAALLDRVRELEHGTGREPEAAGSAEELRKRHQALREKYSAACHDKATLNQLVGRYRSALAQFQRDLDAIRASARWRLGNRLVRLFELLLLRGRPPLLIDRLYDKLSEARQWKPRS